MNLRSLTPAEVIIGETIIGVTSLRGLGVPDAVDIPSKHRLLDSGELVVSPPQGDRVDDPTTVAEVSAELARLLRGPFDQDLTGYVLLFDSLVSAETREMYAAGGMRIGWDRPRVSFSWLAAGFDGWQVQAIGELHDFHAVATCRRLTEAEAIGRGGHPRIRPLGPLPDLLGEVAPEILRHRLHDASEQYTPNTFDTVLTGDGLRVRSGVRLGRSAATSQTQTSRTYLYVVRIDAQIRDASPA